MPTRILLLDGEQNKGAQITASTPDPIGVREVGFIGLRELAKSLWRILLVFSDQTLGKLRRSLDMYR